MGVGVAVGWGTGVGVAVGIGVGTATVGAINGVAVGTGRVGGGIGVLNGVGIGVFDIVGVTIGVSAILLQAAKRGPKIPAVSPRAVAPFKICLRVMCEANPSGLWPSCRDIGN